MPARLAPLDSRPFFNPCTKRFPMPNPYPRAHQTLTDRVRRLPGLKHKDVQPCGLCRKGVAHSGHPLFYVLEVSRYGIDSRAVQRAHGLELVLGLGQGMATDSDVARIANVMGPDEDLVKQIDPPEKFWICHPCAMELPVSFHAMLEVRSQQREYEREQAKEQLAET